MELVFRPRMAAAAAILLMACGTSGATAADKVQHGIASIYTVTPKHIRTASGQKLNPSAFTAAHRTLPFGTSVRVVNHRNGRSVVVTINDRGPFIRGRIIDVTPAGARSLGFSGLTKVSVERVN
jgi:rare lipoprotein A